MDSLLSLRFLSARQRRPSTDAWRVTFGADGTPSGWEAEVAYWAKDAARAPPRTFSRRHARRAAGRHLAGDPGSCPHTGECVGEHAASWSAQRRWSADGVASMWAPGSMLHAAARERMLDGYPCIVLM